MSTRSGSLNARVRRGVVRASVTRIDRKISTLEEKEELIEKDRQSVPRTLKKLGELKAEFKTYHYAVVEQIEEEQDLTPRNRLH